MGVNFMRDINLMIADDQPLSLVGLRSAVADQPDIRIIAECQNPQRLAQAVRFHPDVLLVNSDILSDELGALRQLVSQAKKTRVIVVTTHKDREFLDGALECGARGVIHTDCPVNEIPAAIRKVTGGGLWLEEAA
jgi:two-component system, NarL family, nitrate/nitrite response regulator NarL